MMVAIALTCVPYLGEGRLGFAVFIPPVRKKSVKCEYLRRSNSSVKPGVVSDSQQDALSSLQQFAARGVDEDPIFFQGGAGG